MSDSEVERIITPGGHEALVSKPLADKVLRSRQAREKDDLVNAFLDDMDKVLATDQPDGLMAVWDSVTAPEVEEEVIVRTAAAPEVEDEQQVPEQKRTRGDTIGKGRIILGVVAVSLTLGAGAAVVTANAGGEPEGCATATRSYERVDGSWQEVANNLSQERGYVISGARLAIANKNAKDYDDDRVEQLANVADSKVEDEPLNSGAYCLIVPAPLAGGQREGDGSITLKRVSMEMGVPEESLLKLNDTVKSADQPVPAGTIIWLTPKPNTDLILRPLGDQTIRELVGDDGEKLQEILVANLDAFDGNGFEKGKAYYLPVDSAPVTENLKELDLTPTEIVEANEVDYDYERRNEPRPEPTTDPTPTPEASKPITELTPEQVKIIDSLDKLSAEQKQFIKDLTLVVMQVRPELHAKGVNIAVMLAQGIHESGFGTDPLAKEGHNYFGMKANHGWTGKTISNDTFEFVNGVRVDQKDEFRAYDDMRAGVLGYGENLASKDWYDDALRYPLDDSLYLDGLLNTLDEKGNIKVPRELAYATDPDYKSAILGVINTYRIHDIINAGPAFVPPTPSATPNPESTAPQPIIGPVAPGNIRLDPNRYNDNSSQRQLPPNKGDGKWVTNLKGEQVLSQDISYQERLEIIEKELNAVSTSTAEFDQFVRTLVDARADVAAKGLDNFDGDPDLGGKPNVNRDINYFIWHFTATSSSATDYGCVKAAGSMQNGGRHVGIQYYMNKDGLTCKLTDQRTFHTLADRGIYFNREAFGVEIAAVEQADISAWQYEQGIYLTAQFLIENGFIDKEHSITPVISKMILGHREANPNGHSDNPGIVMDQVRSLLVEFLVNKMGYKA